MSSTFNKEWILVTKDQFMHAFNHELFIRMNSIYGVGKPCTIPMSNDYYKVCHDTLEFVRRQYMLEETKSIDNANEFVWYMINYTLEMLSHIDLLYDELDRIKYNNILNTITNISMELGVIADKEVKELRYRYE